MLICLTLLLMDVPFLRQVHNFGALFIVRELGPPTPPPTPLHSPPPTNVLLYPSLFSATFQTAAILDLVLGKALNIM